MKNKSIYGIYINVIQNEGEHHLFIRTITVSSMCAMWKVVKSMYLDECVHDVTLEIMKGYEKFMCIDIPASRYLKVSFDYFASSSLRFIKAYVKKHENLKNLNA